MIIKENYLFTQVLGLVLLLFGLSGTLGNGSYSSPIMIALGIIIFTSGTFKSKKYNNRMVYNSIVLVALVILLIGEYLLIPVKNTLFYIILIIMAITLFMASSSFLITESRLNKREKTVMGVELIIFIITFFALGGVISNDFTGSIFGGVIASIAIVIGLLIRRTILKDTLKDSA